MRLAERLAQGGRLQAVIDESQDARDGQPLLINTIHYSNNHVLFIWLCGTALQYTKDGQDACSTKVPRELL